MARRARPTLRCLREDLMQVVPPADTPLDEVPHPLLAKASERFADDGTPRERIASVDDQVLFKVKVQRWRGAVWMADDAIPRLVAAGQREEGSSDDFDAALTAHGKGREAPGGRLLRTQRGRQQKLPSVSPDATAPSSQTTCRVAPRAAPFTDDA
jgi:hypothetical protein